MDFDWLQLETEDKMDKVIESYQTNLNKISAGRANPAVLNNVKVNYYGSMTPIIQLANISIPDPKQMVIKPYDISVNKEIVAAINNASLGFHAVDEGNKSRITLPELTSERRRILVKSFARYTEQARIGIRFIRQEINKEIKSEGNISEDSQRNMLSEIQNLTNKFIEKISFLAQKKEKDLMTL